MATFSNTGTLFSLFAILTFAVCSLPAHAQITSTYWISATDTDWFNCDNWSNNPYLRPDATTDCNVTPTSADKVEITSGWANLDGRLSVTMTGDFSSAPTQYILLHGSGGLYQNTNFASVSIKYPTGHGWHPTITYDYNNGYVYLNRIFDLHP